MGVAGGTDGFTILVLPACLDVPYPVIRQDLVECRSVFRVGLQHAANDVPTFPRQDPEKSPWALDDFLALPGILG